TQRDAGAELEPRSLRENSQPKGAFRQSISTPGHDVETDGKPRRAKLGRRGKFAGPKTGIGGNCPAPGFGVPGPAPPPDRSGTVAEARSVMAAQPTYGKRMLSRPDGVDGPTRAPRPADAHRPTFEGRCAQGCANYAYPWRATACA